MPVYISCCRGSLIKRNIGINHIFLFAIWYFYFCLLADPCIDQGSPDLSLIPFHICVCSPELHMWPQRADPVHTPLVTPRHISIASSQREAPPSKLMVLIIWSLSDCLWEIADCWWGIRTSVSLANKATETEVNWPIRNNIQMRSHLEWIYQDQRLSVIIAPQYTPSGWQSLKIWCLIH